MFRRPAIAAALAALSLGIVSDRQLDVQAAPAAPAIVIGDSVIADQLGSWVSAFPDAGLANVFIDAQGGRAIETSSQAWFGWVISGVDRVTTLRATGADAPIWVVQLGSNNLSALGNCRCDQRAEARRLIDAMRAAIGDRTIVWVNTRYQVLDATSNLFNDVLWAVAREVPTFHVLDWQTYSAGRGDWFVDDVHTTTAGAQALSRCTAASVAWLRSTPPTPSTTTSTVAPPAGSTVAGAATATAPGIRLGRTGRDLPTCAVL